MTGLKTGFITATGQAVRRAALDEAAAANPGPGQRASSFQTSAIAPLISRDVVIGSWNR